MTSCVVDFPAKVFGVTSHKSRHGCEETTTPTPYPLPVQLPALFMVIGFGWVSDIQRSLSLPAETGYWLGIKGVVRLEE